MKIERFEVPGLAQYSYMVSADGKAAVVDAIRDIDGYLEYAAKNHLRITHVLETHIHADFATGSLALAESTGAKLLLSAHDEGEHYRSTMPHRDLHDGESLEIGSVRIEALNTPGHTPEHLSLIVFDTLRNAAIPVALLSGDFLFVASLGRPDLLGEEAKLGLAHELFRSLHERIAHLPDGIEIHPGHGAGSLCGAAMSDRPISTLGYERATNSLFAMDENAFVAEILRSVPPMPSYYRRMKQLNARGAYTHPTLPGGTPLSALALAELSRHEDAIILDLRRPEAFGGAHIPGAINIGAGQNLSLWAGWLLDPEKRIVLVGDTGDDEASRRSLIRVGLDRIEGFLEGGMQTWIDEGAEFARLTQRSIHEVQRRSTEPLVVDVRTETEWNAGHIEGAFHLMLGDLPKRMQTLPRNRPIIVVCGSGYRSSIAASLLAADGFEDVSSMDGGMSAWNHQTLAIV